MPIPGSPGGLININNLVIKITVNEVNGTMACVPSRPIPHLQMIAILSTIIIAQVEDSVKQAMAAGNALLNPNDNPANKPPGGNGGN